MNKKEKHHKRLQNIRKGHQITFITPQSNFPKLKCACKMLNPFPNKPWFSRVCSTSLLKTLWEKEKLLLTSNFSFFRSVFFPLRKLSAIFIEFEIVICKLFQFGRVQNLSFGKGLNTSIRFL